MEKVPGAGDAGDVLVVTEEPTERAETDPVRRTSGLEPPARRRGEVEKAEEPRPGWCRIERVRVVVAPPARGGDCNDASRE